MSTGNERVELATLAHNWSNAEASAMVSQNLAGEMLTKLLLIIPPPIQQVEGEPEQG